MVKSVFISPEKTDGIGTSGANYLIVTENGLDPKNWEELKKLNTKLAISLNSFVKGGCPADPKAGKRLGEKIKRVLGYKPDELWFDHFRFDGKWEEVQGENRVYAYKGAHKICEFCEGTKREKVVIELANFVRSIVPQEVRIGYFAVPIKLEESPELRSQLGQDHALLGKIFDMSSPMLYHRMINRPVSYISEFVSYLHNLTGKEVLPIIQVKDMPDDLEDTMGEDEISSAYYEAIKSPSSGVSFFWWTHALEKNKTGIIRRLFS